LTEDEPFKLKAFGIFEGGGAKGLAHVGALRALEEKNVDFVGIAGTSAGAIVAALVGVGYRSHQMFNPHSDERIGVFDTDLHRFLFTLFANVNIIHRTLLFVSHPVRRGVKRNTIDDSFLCRIKSKCSCFPICRSCHLELIPTENVSVKFLLVARKIDVKTHVLQFTVNFFYAPGVSDSFVINITY